MKSILKIFSSLWIFFWLLLPTSWAEQTLSSAGWHLVHMGTVSSTDLDTLVTDQSNIHSIWGWNSELQNWQAKFRSPQLEILSRFAKLQSLNEGQGYWIRITGTVTIPSSTGTPSFNQTADTGWYLLGTGADLSDFTGMQTFDGTATTTAKGSLWTWDPTANSWGVFVNNNGGSVSASHPLQTLITNNAITTVSANSGFWVNTGEVSAPPLQGQVATFPPTLGTARQVAQTFQQTETNQEFSEADFQGQESQVSIYHVDDYQLATTLALVTTDTEGNYQITCSDLIQFSSNLSTVSEIQSLPGDCNSSPNRDSFKIAFTNIGAIKIRAVYSSADSETVELFAVHSLEEDVDAENEIVRTSPLTSVAAMQIDQLFQALGIDLTGLQVLQFKPVLASLGETQTRITLGDGQTKESFRSDFEIGAERAVLGAASNEITGLVANFEGDLIDRAVEGSFGTLNKVGGGSFSLANFNNPSDPEFGQRRKESFQRFFLSLGASITTTNNTIITAFNAPPNFASSEIAGTTALGNIIFREFSLASSVSTQGLAAGQSIPDLTTQVNEITQLFDPSNANVDVAEAVLNGLIFRPPSSLTEQERKNLERVELMHQFGRQLEPVISDAAINQMMLASTNTVTVKRLAAVVAENFVWRTEPVNLVEQNGQIIPIYSGKQQVPSSGETVSSDELLSRMRFRLGINPQKAAEELTNDESYYGLFVREALKEQMSRSQAEGEFFTFPQSRIEYRDFVLGVESRDIPPSFAFDRARRALQQGMVAAFPPPGTPNSLYGETIGAETELTVKAAFFFLKVLLESEYLIDASAGFFEEFVDAQNFLRLQPRFNNFKFLSPKSESFSVSTLVAGLLNQSAFSDGDAHTALEAKIRNIAEGEDIFSELPQLPEFQSDQDFQDRFIGNQSRQNVEVVCHIVSYDFQNISSSEFSAQLFPARFGFEGAEIAGDPITMTLTPGTFAELRATNVPPDQEYLIQITSNEYRNKIPSIPLFVDGFANPLEVCPPDEPFEIPPDQEQRQVPGITLFANSGEGATLSNFSSGEPFLTLSTTTDFYFVRESGTFLLRTDDSAGSPQARIAPLYADFSSASPSPTLTDNGNPLIGLQTAFGFNFGSLLTSPNLQNSASFMSISDPEALFQSQFDDGPPVYLLQDTEGEFWLLEVRYINRNQDKGVIDIGFAQIQRDGSLDTTSAEFGPPLSSDVQRVNLFFGDYLQLSLNPITHQITSGNSDFTFGYNSTVASAAQLRYAGNKFEEAKALSELSSIFGNPTNGIPSNFSSVNPTLEVNAENSGANVLLGRLTYNETQRSYTVASTGTSISSWDNGDMLALDLDNDQAFDLFAYIQKRVGDLEANREIELLLTEYTLAVTTAGQAFTAQSAGHIIDNDLDGVPEIFDPNDEDPNVKLESFGGPGGPSGPGGEDSLRFFLATSNGGGNLVGMRFTGPVQQIDHIRVRFPSDINEGLSQAETVRRFVVDVNNSTVDTSLGQSVAVATTNEGSILTPDELLLWFPVNNPSNSLAFLDLSTESSEINAKFEFGVSFNSVVDPSGNTHTAPLPIEDDFILNIASSASGIRLGSFSTVQFREGTESFQTLTDGAVFSSSKTMEISWSPVSNALEYELRIFSTDSHNPFEHVVTIPPQNTSFTIAPGTLPSQTLNLVLLAVGKNLLSEPTDQRAYYVAGGITVPGGGSGGPGGPGGSELDVAVNELVCFNSNNFQFINNGTNQCFGDNIHTFTVNALNSGSGTENMEVTLAVAASVQESPETLAEGGLTAGNSVRTDSVFSCGEIQGDTIVDNFECSQTGGIATDTILTLNTVAGNVFSVSIDQSSYALAQMGTTITDLNVLNSGFYEIRRLSDGISVLGIDLQPQGSNAGASVRLEKFTAGQNFDSGSNATVEVGQELALQIPVNNQIQPGNVVFKFILANKGKLEWFLGKPFSEFGSPLDLNGDGFVDINWDTSSNGSGSIFRLLASPWSDANTFQSIIANNSDVATAADFPDVIFQESVVEVFVKLHDDPEQERNMEDFTSTPVVAEMLGNVGTTLNTILPQLNFSAGSTNAYDVNFLFWAGETLPPDEKVMFTISVTDMANVERTFEFTLDANERSLEFFEEQNP